jgi:hypothetical protein
MYWPPTVYPPDSIPGTEFKVGRWFMTRDGAKAQIVGISNENWLYPLEVEYPTEDNMRRLLTVTGHYMVRVQHACDLISPFGEK